MELGRDGKPAPRRAGVSERPDRAGSAAGQQGPRDSRILPQLSARLGNPRLCSMQGGTGAANLLLSALPPWMIYFDTRLQPVLLHHSKRFIASGLGWRHPPHPAPAARERKGALRACRWGL